MNSSLSRDRSHPLSVSRSLSVVSQQLRNPIDTIQRRAQIMNDHVNARIPTPSKSYSDNFPPDPSAAVGARGGTWTRLNFFKLKGFGDVVYAADAERPRLVHGLVRGTGWSRRGCFSVFLRLQTFRRPRRRWCSVDVGGSKIRKRQPCAAGGRGLPLGHGAPRPMRRGVPLATPRRVSSSREDVRFVLACRDHLCHPSSLLAERLSRRLLL